MKIVSIIIYLSIFSSIPTFAFGQARVRESRELIKVLQEKKEVLMNQIDHKPYRAEQHAAIKGYFENMSELNESLADDWRLNKRFNQVFSELDFEEICQKLWLDSSAWTQLVKNCTKNRFFICSEKVRNYKLLREGFENQLSDFNREKYKQTKACKMELENQ